MKIWLAHELCSCRHGSIYSHRISSLSDRSQEVSVAYQEGCGSYAQQDHFLLGDKGWFVNASLQLAALTA